MTQTSIRFSLPNLKFSAGHNDGLLQLPLHFQSAQPTKAMLTKHMELFSLPHKLTSPNSNTAAKDSDKSFQSWLYSHRLLPSARARAFVFGDTVSRFQTRGDSDKI